LLEEGGAVGDAPTLDDPAVRDAKDVDEVHAHLASRRRHAEELRLVRADELVVNSHLVALRHDADEVGPGIRERRFQVADRCEHAGTIAADAGELGRVVVDEVRRECLLDGVEVAAAERVQKALDELLVLGGRHDYTSAASVCSTVSDSSTRPQTAVKSARQ
jgi:hypothetical protein